MNHNETEPGLFPISTVSALTGVNAITLRAWERRYGLIRPSRNDAGHRLYTEGDVGRIRAILQMLDEGIALSRVSDALRQGAQRTDAVSTESAPWSRYQTASLEAVAQFDEGALERVYNEAISIYPVDLVTRQLLLPLLKALDERSMQKGDGVAEERFFVVFLRNKLGARLHHRSPQNDGPRLVAACLPGEHREFGILLFALSAHACGYRIILLGADMPLAKLPEVVRRTHSEAIVLSGSHQAVEDDLEQDLSALLRLSTVPVFVAGTYAQRRRQALADLGLSPIGDDPIVGLHALEKLLPAATVRCS